MALIKCPECEKEISDTIKKCPNCGYKIKKTSKKAIVAIISALIVVLVGITTFVVISSNNKKMEAKQYEREYNELLTEVGGRIYLNGLISQLYCYDIGQVWYNSIFDKSDYRYDKYTKEKYGYGYNDFSTSIANYKNANDESLNKLKEVKNEIGNDIKQLKKLPNEDYQDVYDEIVIFYGVFSKLVDSAVSPSGTYKDYISTYNSYASDFEASYNRLIVLKPEIKDYKE